MNMLGKLFEDEFFKSKIYSLKTVDGGEKSTHKEHKSFIMYDEYQYIRSNKEVIRNNIREFKSKNHEIFTSESNKIFLCDFDNKRYILHDGIYTLPYGHTKIYQQEIDKIKKIFLNIKDT